MNSRYEEEKNRTESNRLSKCASLMFELSNFPCLLLLLLMVFNEITVAKERGNLIEFGRVFLLQHWVYSYSYMNTADASWYLWEISKQEELDRCIFEALEEVAAYCYAFSATEKTGVDCLFVFVESQRAISAFSS